MDAAAKLAELPPQQEYATSADVASVSPVALARERLGGPVPFVVYVAMFFGALLGSLAGVVYDVVLGQMYLPVVLAFAVLGATYVGARYGRRRMGHPLKPDQRVRIALWYTSGLVGVAGLILTIWPQLLPKWMLARLDGLSPVGQIGALLLTVVIFAAVALLHYLLLSLFTPSNGRSGAVKSAA